MTKEKRCHECFHCKVSIPLIKGELIYNDATVSCKKGMWADYFGQVRSIKYISKAGTFGESPRRVDMEMNCMATKCFLFEAA